MSTFFIKYVKIRDIPEYEKFGWKIVDGPEPCHHCYYAKIMRYYGELDPPPEPNL